jgi:CDP-paratose 2-epimerase
MGLALITGSSGLVGSETATFLINKGFEVIGIDNNERKEIIW